MAQKARAHDCCVVVLSEDRENNEDGKEHQYRHLHDDDEKDRSDQVKQLIQVQTHQRHGKIQVQHDIANAVHQWESEMIPVELLVQVADKHSYEQCADIGREAHSDQLANPAGNLGSKRHAEQDRGHVLQDVQAGELFAVSCIDLFDGSVQGLGVVRCQVVLLNQHACHWSAHQDAEDQAEGRSCCADGDTCRIAHIGKGGTVGACRSVSADHGDGTCQERVGILKACDIGDTDADAVLDDGYDAGNQPVDDQQDATLLQKRKGRAQADSGEKRHHERTLEGRIELERERAALMSGKGDEHEQEATHHRSRNAVLREKAHLLPDPEANQEQYGGQRRRHDHRTADIQCTINSFKRHKFPPFFLTGAVSETRSIRVTAVFRSQSLTNEVLGCRDAKISISL